jgi:hypothetical protein
VSGLAGEPHITTYEDREICPGRRRRMYPTSVGQDQQDRRDPLRPIQQLHPRFARRRGQGVHRPPVAEPAFVVATISPTPPPTVCNALRASASFVWNGQPLTGFKKMAGL